MTAAVTLKPAGEAMVAKLPLSAVLSRVQCLGHVVEVRPANWHCGWSLSSEDALITGGVSAGEGRHARSVLEPGLRSAASRSIISPCFAGTCPRSGLTYPPEYRRHATLQSVRLGHHTPRAHDDRSGGCRHLPEGTAIGVTEATAKKAEQLIGNDQDVESYTTYVGARAPRFWLGLNPELPNTNFAQIVIVTKNLEGRERLRSGSGDRRRRAAAGPRAR
jgi:hypothetical protein